ncbi:MAG: uroporphyrinogen-III synthase [Kofleriaceae bacterium]
MYAIMTRHLYETVPYAQAFEALGLEVIAMPVTRTEPPRDAGALTRAIEAGGHSAILVASPRAALALLGARGHASLFDVWAVGPATAQVLAEAGISAFVPEPAKDAAAAAHAMLAALPLAGKRVLIPRAEGGRDEAIEILRAAGVDVDPIDAYRTAAIERDDPEVVRGRDALVAGEVALCAVFAPSQVAALEAIVGIRSVTTRWIAIGETTAAALREAGAEVISVATEPTPEGIANAAAAVYPAPR